MNKAACYLLLLCGASLLMGNTVEAKELVKAKVGSKAYCTVYEDETAVVEGTGKISLETPKIECYRGGMSYPESIKKICIQEGITELDERAFCYFQDIKEIELPKTIKKMGENVFDNCHSLSAITIPYQVKKIPNEAFRDCKSLKKINLPKRVKSIGEGAFRGCTSLKRLTIPDTVSSIGKKAFQSCNSLTELVLPKNLKSFRADFTKTKKLKKVVNRSKLWIPLDTCGGHRVWKVNGKKVTKLAPGKTAKTKGTKYKLTYSLSGGKACGKLPKYYYYGNEPKLPKVKKKGYTFVCWRRLHDYMDIPKSFPKYAGDDMKLTAILIKLKVERISDKKVRVTIKDNIDWNIGKRILDSDCFTPRYGIRVSTRKITEGYLEDMSDDTEYCEIKRNKSCVMNLPSSTKTCYIEISFRWHYDYENDYESGGAYSGWHLFQPIKEK